MKAKTLALLVCIGMMFTAGYSLTTDQAKESKCDVTAVADQVTDVTVMVVNEFDVVAYENQVFEGANDQTPTLFINSFTEVNPEFNDELTPMYERCNNAYIFAKAATVSNLTKQIGSTTLERQFVNSKRAKVPITHYSYKPPARKPYFT